MKYRRWLSLPILVVLSSAVQAGTSTNVMTRQNQADLNCAITVQVRTNAVQNWYTFTVSVPKEDTRLKRLFRTAFVLGTEIAPYPQQLDVPLETKTDATGRKEIMVGVGKDRILDSFIKFECFWEDEKRSSLDVVFLDLSSYLMKEK